MSNLNTAVNNYSAAHFDNYFGGNVAKNNQTPNNPNPIELNIDFAKNMLNAFCDDKSCDYSNNTIDRNVLLFFSGHESYHPVSIPINMDTIAETNKKNEDIKKLGYSAMVEIADKIGNCNGETTVGEFKNLLQRLSDYFKSDLKGNVVDFRKNCYEFVKSKHEKIDIAREKYQDENPAEELTKASLDNSLKYFEQDDALNNDAWIGKGWDPCS